MGDSGKWEFQLSVFVRMERSKNEQARLSPHPKLQVQTNSIPVATETLVVMDEKGREGLLIDAASYQGTPLDRGFPSKTPQPCEKGYKGDF